MHVKTFSKLNEGTETPINQSAQELVRLGFNPSEDATVDRIKMLAAALMSEVGNLKIDDHNAGRHASLAVTATEEAAMWAVKVATTSK